MDRTLSAYQVAEKLGTSIPRVVREAKRIAPEAHVGDRYAFTPSMVRKLRRSLGVNPPVLGLTAEQARVLKVLSVSPYGARSARSLAQRAHVSPTTAARAIRSLVAKDLARSTEQMVAMGRPARVHLVQANVSSPAWPEVARQLQRVRLPEQRVERDTTVPRQLHHLFWNTSADQMNVDADGGYIARRLLGTKDPQGLAWGASNLRAADWRHAATARGLDARTRALAENLAAQSPER